MTVIIVITAINGAILKYLKGPRDANPFNIAYANEFIIPFKSLFFVTRLLACLNISFTDELPNTIDKIHFIRKVKKYDKPNIIEHLMINNIFSFKFLSLSK